MARGFSKCNALCLHRGIVAREIIRMQKEAHPAARLVADYGLLRVAIGLREQQRRLRAGRRNTAPASLSFVSSSNSKPS